jgi:NADPH2:quinone reductase
MKAMVINQHGGLDVFQFRDRPEPTLRERDILIRVQATSVNPVDYKIRRGGMITRKFPLILGYDVSGTVVAMGKAVSRFKLGDEVYASPNLFGDGANAQYVAVDSRTAALKPKSLDHVASAVLPLVSLAAWESLHERVRIPHGQTLLIHAGAGGVGHIAVQLAKLHGCRVITTAGRNESIGFCREILRTDEVIDYRTTDFSARMMEISRGKGAPVILDFVGGEVFEKSMECIAANGQLVTIVPTTTEAITDKLFIKNVSLYYEFMGAPTMYGIQPERQGEILRIIANLVDGGYLKPHISHRIPISELSKGHELQEQGHVMGKIAVLVAEDKEMVAS